MTTLTDQQWETYQQQGYLRLGKVLNDEDLAAMQARFDEIMTGRAGLDYSKLLMQLDSESGEYGDAGEQSMGFKGATLNYRKIQNLEFDPFFLRYMQRPLFRDICERAYGEDTPISCFRAMFMNKPSKRGTFLPWHQDRWTDLTADPLVTVYTAVDAATKENGCVQYIPASHGELINPEHNSGFLTEEQADALCPPEKREFLELEAGEVALLHNWTLHGSDVNRSDQSRRAFSVCYMPAETRSRSSDSTFPVIFGDDALDPEAMETASAPEG
ncbi:MAG: phytanoyl-CoA dioxygenase family protein [Phycisphaeraceae bacterium]|nr:phytanoyl-CoA dioxygenase family protein [Phycisphaeraceae bacterium]